MPRLCPAVAPSLFASKASFTALTRQNPVENPLFAFLNVKPYVKSMDKNFDVWNREKKNLNERNAKSISFFHEREVWFCSIGLNVGVEQDGKNELFERPVLIVKRINKDSFVGFPLSTGVKRTGITYSFEYQGVKRSLLIHQMRSFSSKRLRRKIFTMNQNEFTSVLSVARNLFKNDTPVMNGGISEAEAEVN